MRRTALTITAAIAMALAGCGSDVDTDSTKVESSAAPTSSAGADPFQDGGQPGSGGSSVDAVNRYIAARAAGDGATVCSLYTDTMAAEELSTTDEDEATTCAESIDLAGPKDFFDADQVERVTEIPDSIYGTEVVVLYANNSEDHVVLEQVDGMWRIRNILDS